MPLFQESTTYAASTEDQFTTDLNKFNDCFTKSNAIEIREHALGLMAAHEEKMRKFLADRGIDGTSKGFDGVIKQSGSARDRFGQKLVQDIQDLTSGTKSIKSSGRGHIEPSQSEIVAEAMIEAQKEAIQEMNKLIEDQKQALGEAKNWIHKMGDAKDGYKSAMEKKSNPDETFVIEFTDASKLPKIHDILTPADIKSDENVFIDYSACTNPQIGAYLTRHGISGKQVQIVAGKRNGVDTYLLVGPDGKPINARALVRPGVKIFSKKATELQREIDQRKQEARQAKEKPKDVIKNLSGLKYSFESIEQAQEFNDAVVNVFDVLKAQCRVNGITPIDVPFSKTFVGTGHFQFDGRTKDGKSFEVDPVFPKSALSDKLYEIIDNNEDVFVSYLNERRNTEYTQDVVERQKECFIPGIDINRGSEEDAQKMKGYLDDIVSIVMNDIDNNPPEDGQPFKVSTATGGEIYYDGSNNQDFLYDDEEIATYFKSKGFDMSDDKLNKKLCDYLNAEFAKQHLTVTGNETLTTNKDDLKKKIQADGNMVGVGINQHEYRDLAIMEQQDYNALMEKFDISKAADYLSLYTHDQALKEGQGDLRLERLRAVADKMIATNPDQAFQTFLALHAQYDAEKHPDSVYFILRQFTGHFGQKLADVRKGKGQTISTENQKKLLSLVHLVTGRMEDMKTTYMKLALAMHTGLSMLCPTGKKPGDIDDDLRDLGLAQSIMADLMPGVIDAAKTDFDAQQKAEFEKNKSTLTAYFGDKISLGGIETVKIDEIDRSRLSFQEKAALTAHIKYVKRFPTKPSEDTELKDNPNLLKERIFLLASHAQEDLMAGFADFIDDGVGGKNLELQGLNKEIYDTYTDMIGAGWFNLSDENVTKAVEGSKMAGVIVVAVAASFASAGLATGPALVSIFAAAGGSIAGFTADMLINQRQYTSREGVAKDFFSTLATDIATSGPFALVPGIGPLLARIPKLGSIFRPIARTIEIAGKKYNTAEILVSGVISGQAEALRQEFIMHQDLSFEQII
ncbi:MAG: hypothetical protein NZL83_00585 [Candidatus Absconditabacterales bacterium]|nr:hypothetical protein [Candidatus Absconditabacterales bacterium]